VTPRESGSEEDIMDSRLVMAAVVTALLAVIHTGEAIKCHQCTSYNDPQCADPFFEDSQGEKKQNNPATECEWKEDSGHPQPYFCRKIYQNVRGDERIIRSCGWEPYKKNESNCYKTVLEEYNTYVCQCWNKEDGEACNNSNMLSMSIMAVVSAMFLAALIH